MAWNLTVAELIEALNAIAIDQDTGVRFSQHPTRPEFAVVRCDGYYPDIQSRFSLVRSYKSWQRHFETRARVAGYLAAHEAAEAQRRAARLNGA